jgi:hypothetical protein
MITHHPTLMHVDVVDGKEKMFLSFLKKKYWNKPANPAVSFINITHYFV